MNRSLPLLALLAIVPFLAAAEPPIPPPLVERLKQASFPSFQLNQATIHEALARLKSEWIRQHPGESFSIVLIEDPCLANLSPDGTSLTVRQTPEQMSLIPGILHLLASGFTVEPPASPPK